MTSVPEGIVAVPVHQSARTAARDEGSRMSWWVLLHYQCPHPRTFPSRWDGEEERVLPQRPFQRPGAGTARSGARGRGACLPGEGQPHGRCSGGWTWSKE